MARRNVKTAPAKAQAIDTKEPQDGQVLNIAQRPNDAAPGEQISGQTMDGDILPPPAKTQQSEPGTGNILMVRTAPGILRFRRAGLSFGPQPVTLDASALSEEQIQALKDEPMLFVERG